MGRCHACEGTPYVEDEELLSHIRVIHPDLWGDGPERWPDGGLVIHDMTLEIADFTDPTD